MQFGSGPIGVSLVYFVAAAAHAVTNLVAGAIVDKLVRHSHLASCQSHPYCLIT